MINWATVKKPLSELKPATYNPRTISDRAREGLSQSIERFGLVQPIVWNKRTGNIVGGHQRYDVLISKGVTETEVVEVDLDDQEEQVLNIALNNPEIQGEWDDKIGPLLKSIYAGSADLFERLRMDDLAESLRVSVFGSGKKGDDDVPDLPKTAVSQTGKVYVLGKNRIICGDSTCQDVLVKLMAGKKADMLLTDPPYNVDYQGGTKDGLKIANDKMSEEKFIQFLTNALRAADAVMREAAAFYIWHACVESFSNNVACRNVNWRVRQTLIWLKDRLVLGRNDYHFKHEPLLYGWKDLVEAREADKAVYDEDYIAALYGWRDGPRHTWKGGRKLTTVLEFPRPTASSIHPTMKPVEMFEFLIWNNTKPGDIVLDLFCGSGTTVIAAEKSDRIAYCVELDPLYCDVIRERWAEYIHGDGCNWQVLTPEEGTV